MYVFGDDLLVLDNQFVSIFLVKTISPALSHLSVSEPLFFIKCL